MLSLLVTFSFLELEQERLEPCFLGLRLVLLTTGMIGSGSEDLLSLLVRLSSKVVACLFPFCKMSFKRNVDSKPMDSGIFLLAGRKVGLRQTLARQFDLRHS